MKFLVQCQIVIKTLDFFFNYSVKKGVFKINKPYWNNLVI